MDVFDNFSKFRELREEYPFFSFESYQYHFNRNTLEILYTFNLSDKYVFTPKIIIPYKKKLFRPFRELSSEALNNLVFHAGIIELISYWKTACPKQVILQPHHIPQEQVIFWKNIFFHGLGEFFYVNSIATSFEDFMEIRSAEDKPLHVFNAELSGGSLVPVGGGKDSSLTLDLMHRWDVDWLPFTINPLKATREVIGIAGKNMEDTVEFDREIHPLLLKMNEKGFLNGHTPFSALLAFYSLLAAYLTGRNDIVLSNESSANEVTIPGTKINHQYSKSIEFERDFRNYTSKFISPQFNYFSLLRPLSELQIAWLFSKIPSYHLAFRSCNVGSKTGTWCGKCPKCLFTFIILSPFLTPEYMTGIFGKDLFDDPQLRGTMDELTGIAENKPFECIGTVDEVNAALQQTIKKYAGHDLPYLLKAYSGQKAQFIDLDARFEERLHRFGADHCVPEKYMKLWERETR